MKTISFARKLKKRALHLQKATISLMLIRIINYPLEMKI